MSNPWEEYPHIWSTQASFMNFVRGGIRKALWNRHPVKIEFIRENRFKAPLGKQTKSNPEGLVWACECVLCGKTFRESECEVDHKSGNHSLKSAEDLREFVENIIFVTKDQLQMVDKECHRIKSYADRMGISFEEAKKEKEVIAFGKKKVNEQKEILLALDPKADTSNAKKRKDEYRRLIQ